MNKDLINLKSFSIMKKSILNFGTPITKTQQKEIHGGINTLPCVCRNKPTLLVSCFIVCDDGSYPILAVG